MKKFVQNIVTFSLRNTTFILFATFALLFAGIYGLKHTAIEAFPDVTNTRARIIIQWPGRSAEEVEKLVTLPISKEMNSIPRKNSLPGALGSCAETNCGRKVMKNRMILGLSRLMPSPVIQFWNRLWPAPWGFSGEKADPCRIACTASQTR